MALYIGKKIYQKAFRNSNTEKNL